jgi:hypothetical protein
MGPPHTLHETIRIGKTAGFSHWGTHVIFSLPPEVENGPDTIATLSYGVRPRAWIPPTLTILSALLAFFVYAAPLRSFAEASGLRSKILRAPYAILSGLCWVGLLGSAIYVASSVYAFATGWALPTTALIRWSPVAEWAASNEPYFGYLLLTLAGLGTATTWLIGSSARHEPLPKSSEQSLRRALFWCGFPIAACAFVLCTSAMWAGMIRQGDSNALNIGGLVPFSDAGNYLAASFDQVKDGVWSWVALRRPLAAAFRSVLLLLGDYSLQYMLILQACLIAGAACSATYAIIRWRGVWAGIAFFALTYIYARYFVPTPLTEPQGLFWALLSIPFFIQAFRDRSVSAALAAFAMTTVALMTRMGSMFTIPALLVWLVWQFGQGAKTKLRIGITAICILLGVFGLNSFLQRMYGTDTSPTSGNFSYVLCGLSIGTGWDGCLKKLAAEGTPVVGSEDAMARQLYSAAWKNLSANPAIFFRRLTDSAERFITKFPGVLWNGYGAVEEPRWVPRSVLVLLCLIGLFYGATRTANAVELSFWALLWASIVASSSFIYFDDGARTLAASHPLMALFFALGLSFPTSVSAESPSHSRLARNGFVGLVAAAVLFVCLPWIAHRFSPIGTVVSATPLPSQGAFVFGGRGCPVSSWSKTTRRFGRTFLRFIWQISRQLLRKAAWRIIKI